MIARDVGMQIQRGYHRHLGANLGTDLGQNFAGGVRGLLGHHSPVQDQQHAIHRASGDALEQAVQERAKSFLLNGCAG